MPAALDLREPSKVPRRKFVIFLSTVLLMSWALPRHRALSPSIRQMWSLNPVWCLTESALWVLSLSLIDSSVYRLCLTLCELPKLVANSDWTLKSYCDSNEFNQSAKWLDPLVLGSRKPCRLLSINKPISKWDLISWMRSAAFLVRKGGRFFTLCTSLF